MLVKFWGKLFFGQAIVLLTISRTELPVYGMPISLPIDAARALPLQDVIMLNRHRELSI